MDVITVRKNAIEDTNRPEVIMHATQHLDELLELQLAVAWAGESDTEPGRLGWWRTAMCDEFGGENLMRRLAPKTWHWAVLEAARAAAVALDANLRSQAEDADNLISLFRFGFELDERLGDRLLELKQSEVLPPEAFPRLGELVNAGWTKDGFVEWIERRGKVTFTKTATGRRLTGNKPDDPVAAASQLAVALLPFGNSYPLPHFRLRR